MTCSEIAGGEYMRDNLSNVNLELNIHFNERISYFQVITHPEMLNRFLKKSSIVKFFKRKSMTLQFSLNVGTNTCLEALYMVW